MNPEEMVIKLATGAQCATLAMKVAIELTKKFEGKLSFSQAQIAITDPSQLDIGKMAEKIANEIFAIPIDPWTVEKRKISHFYKTCFTNKKWKNPNWEQVIIPTGDENLKRPEFIFSEMAVQEAFDAYANYFGKDKVWKAWEDISKAIDPETVQPRPKQNYAILHVGGDEPDLLNKSYNDGISENIIFMTPLEGIISAFRYRFETGKMYDVIGVTRLSALDQDGYAMLMCRNTDGKFHVDSRNRASHNPACGLRRVSF
jgi:hypothetical protein